MSDGTTPAELEIRGVRYDGGKDRWDLLPFDAIHELVKVYTFGAQKYADRNWEKGMKWSRILASLFRHLWARLRGERIDPETKLLHTAHLAWNAVALLTYDLRGIGSDDMTTSVGASAGGNEGSSRTDSPSPHRVHYPENYGKLYQHRCRAALWCGRQWVSAVWDDPCPTCGQKMTTITELKSGAHA